MRTQTLRSTQPVGLLADENLIPRGRGRYFLRQARRIWKSVGLLGLLVSCGVLLLPRQHDAAKPDSPPVQNVVADLHEDHILHVLLPTRRIPMETCRTILSGAALNYPNPWLISWHADVDEQMNDLGGDLAKLESILAFLEIQAPTRNEDTVIVLANSNSWFQARPEVLLKRYRSIQQEPQHQSLRQNPTRALWESQHKKENIVLSTERKCLSRPDADCLPVQAADNTLRFVSHSFVMGPIEQVRLFYRDAVAEARGLEANKSAFDEHSVIASLYNFQQYVNSAPNGYSTALDLLDRLSFTATSDASFADWHAPSSTGVDLGNGKRPLLTEDIMESEPPLQNIFDTLHTVWSELSFLIPKKALTVPAIVQNSAEIDASVAQHWYTRLWFHPRGRRVVETFAAPSESLVASFVDEDGVRQRYFSPHNGGLGAVAANNEMHPWAEICEGQDYTQTVFSDGSAVFSDGSGVFSDGSGT